MVLSTDNIYNDCRNISLTLLTVSLDKLCYFDDYGHYSVFLIIYGKLNKFVGFSINLKILCNTFKQIFVKLDIKEFKHFYTFC